MVNVGILNVGKLNIVRFRKGGLRKDLLKMGRKRGRGGKEV